MHGTKVMARPISMILINAQINRSKLFIDWLFSWLVKDYNLGQHLIIFMKIFKSLGYRSWKGGGMDTYVDRF